MAAAVLLMNVNLFSMAMGPVLMGTMKDALRVRHGGMGIRYSLLVLCLPLFWAVFHSLRANRTRLWTSPRPVRLGESGPLLWPGVKAL